MLNLSKIFVFLNKHLLNSLRKRFRVENFYNNAYF